MALRAYLTKNDEHRLIKWHSHLTGQHEARAARAHLRRASGPEGILLNEAFFHFLSTMSEENPKWRESERILGSAMIAGLLAHVDENKIYSHLEDGKKVLSFAAQLAVPLEKGGRTPLSSLRFRNLQKSATPEDFYRNCMNAIKLLRGKANVCSLAHSILHWLDEYEHHDAFCKPMDRLAVQWASDYYKHLPKTA